LNTAAELGYRALPKIIAETIKERILTGAYSPGARLSIASLAKTFEVSALPVREALRNLEALGLVEFEPNKGVTVRALSRDEVRELFLIRRPLEILAATEAMRTASIEAIDELGSLVRAMDTPSDDWLEIHDRFHNGIYGLSGMPLLAQWAALLRDRMRPYRLIHLLNVEQRALAQQDHHELVAAFRRRDAQKVSEIIPRHLLRSAIVGGYAPVSET
jgi:DNA-binding GntR family transcriptional regulator